MTDRMRTVRLYGDLGAKFGREFLWSVTTPAEAVRALCINFQNFEEHIRQENFRYAVLVGTRHLRLRDDPDELREAPGGEDIRIVPILAGAKRGDLFQTVLGAALIVAAFWTGGMSLAAWGVGSSMAFSAGVSLTLGGIAQMLSPQPSMNISDAPENRASNLFDGPVNTVAQGNPVPLVYGHGIVGSSVISAGITAVDS